MRTLTHAQDAVKRFRERAWAEWNRNGREILYAGSDGYLVSVPIKLGAAPELGKPVSLFQAADIDHGDSLADASRFLVAVRPARPEELPIHHIQNWVPPPTQ